MEEAADQIEQLRALVMLADDLECRTKRTLSVQRSRALSKRNNRRLTIARDMANVYALPAAPWSQSHDRPTSLSGCAANRRYLHGSSAERTMDRPPTNREPAGGAARNSRPGTPFDCALDGPPPIGAKALTIRNFIVGTNDYTRLFARGRSDVSPSSQIPRQPCCAAVAAALNGLEPNT